MLAAVLSIALAVSLKEGTYRNSSEQDFRDQDGNHVYYDESIIEKENFHRMHPKEAARSLSRLFGRRSRKGQE